MSGKKENATIVGVGVAACAACCAGPLIGFAAALGIGAVAGAFLLGLLGVFIVGIVGMLWLGQRRRNLCAPVSTVQAVTIEPPRVRDSV